MLVKVAIPILKWMIVLIVNAMGFVSTNKYVGHCPNCGTKYSWVEVYTWQGIEDFKEETNNG